MSLSIQLLHSDELISARCVHCRPHNHVCGATEAAGANTLAFPLRGVFIKHLDDGREVVAHAGQAVFFNAGESYRVSHPQGGDDCFVLELTESVQRELLEAFDPIAANRTATPFRASHAHLPASSLLQQRLLWRCLQESPDHAIEVQERALELFADVLAAAAITPPSRRARPAALRRRREQVREAAIRLALDPAQRWTLDGIARDVHSSPFHLARAFRSEHGLSVHQYLLNARLARALDAVLDSNAPLTEIALGTGFATPSHFTAAFHSRYGITPSDLRRKVHVATARELRRISTVDFADRS
jgi:AraC-like DNA-binding protein